MARLYPPGPANYLAWLGLTYRHFLLLYHNPIRHFQTLKDRFGDVVFWRIFWHKAYLLSHPDYVREVLITKADSFVKQRREMNILRKHIGGDGVVSAEGPKWISQRRIMLPAFQSAYAQRFAECLISEARLTASSWKSGEIISTNQAMVDMLVTAVCQALFGVEARERAPELGAAMNQLSQEVIDDFRSPFRMTAATFGFKNRRREAIMKVLTDFIDETIQKRRQEKGSTKDFISILIAATDREEGGRQMSNQDLRTEALTMLFAGHHTAASTLTWSLYLLAKNEKASQRLIEEVGETLSNRMATPADINHLDYATRVVKESLRIYPSAWALFGREAIEDVQVGSYVLPKGAFVFIAPLLIHRDARWFPDPMKFDPDRFLPDNEDQMTYGTYLPFGLGGHSCLGSRAAMLALPLALVTLLQNHRLELLPHHKEPVLEPLISIRPKGDIKLKVLARRSLQNGLPVPAWLLANTGAV